MPRWHVRPDIKLRGAGPGDRALLISYGVCRFLAASRDAGPMPDPLPGDPFIRARTRCDWLLVTGRVGNWLPARFVGAELALDAARINGADRRLVADSELQRCFCRGFRLSGADCGIAGTESSA